MLTLMLAIPLAAALVVLLLPGRATRLLRGVSVGATFAALAVSVALLAGFDGGMAGMQFHEGPHRWIPAFRIHYELGVDGLSLPLVLLTTLLSFLSCVGSLHIGHRIKEYFFWFLLLEVGMLGVFVALDFFLFYIFWELVLVPMYFLIGIWGGPQKEYAAIKFFLYTLFGSVIMLVGILALYFKASTFSFLELQARSSEFGGAFGKWVFLAMFLGFAIKVPIFPFHTWLPLAHVEAPTAVSVLLAGVLLKMGTYGFLRISFPILPEAARLFAYPLAILALVSILVGSFAAMWQKDMKRMVAYSSVNHMGYAMLGMASLTPIGFTGATMQMVTHGLITGALFLLVGVIYDRAHTRDLDAFGGLANKTPVYSGFMWLMALASLGLPGLAGFVSELFCFLGAFQVPALRWIVVVGLIGVVVTAAFFLQMIRRVFLGELPEKWKGLTDMDAREWVAVAPLAVLTIFIGLYPKPALDLMNRTLEGLARLLTGA